MSPPAVDFTNLADAVFAWMVCEGVPRDEDLVHDIWRLVAPQNYARTARTLERLRQECSEDSPTRERAGSAGASRKN